MILKSDGKIYEIHMHEIKENLELGHQLQTKKMVLGTTS